MNEGCRRQAVSLPVGSGKTVIIANIIQQIPQPTSFATKTLVLAHRQELVEQAAAQIQRFCPALRVGIDQGSRHADVVNSDVVVASVPTLALGRMQKYDPAEFKGIIVDEAHHATAKTYRSILNHFAVDRPDTDKFLWGCSATLMRNDATSLGKVFDKISFHQSINDLISGGWLCPVKVTSVKTNVELDAVVNISSTKSDYDLESLARAVDNPERNRLIVDTWRRIVDEKLSNSGTQIASTLVFATNVRHVDNLCSEFRSRGINASSVTGSTGKFHRRSILSEFKQQKYPVLVNCGILTEGTDIPNIDCILLARPTKSPLLLQQMLGRGMRLSPGKSECTVVDFVDNCTRNSPVAVPTLLGMGEEVELTLLPPGAIVKQKSEIKTLNDNNSKVSISMQITKQDWDPFKEYTATHKKWSMNLQSRWNWYSLPNGACLLNLPESRKLLIKQSNESLLFEAEMKFCLRSKWTKLAISGDSIETAIRASETYIRSRYGNMYDSYLCRYAKWRRQPATAKQIDYARRLGALKHTKLLSSDMTKGELEQLITYLQHGRH